jgi:hypothetical protein
MTTFDKERLFNLVANATQPGEKEAAYDAIALAERDEHDANAQRLLHEAALEIMRGNLDRAQNLLSSIDPEPA